MPVPDLAARIIVPAHFQHLITSPLHIRSMISLDPAERAGRLRMDFNGRAFGRDVSGRTEEAYSRAVANGIAYIQAAVSAQVVALEAEVDQLVANLYRYCGEQARSGDITGDAYATQLRKFFPNLGAHPGTAAPGGATRPRTI